MPTPAEFVKAARKLLNMTQAELAEVLGLERRSIMRYEQGGELPRAIRLAILHVIHLAGRRRKQSKRRKQQRRKAARG